MDQETIEAVTQQPLGEQTLDTPIHKISFRSFLKQIKKDKSGKGNDRNMLTVLKTSNMRIVLYAIRKGTEMIKQKKEGTITLQVLEGKIQFNSGNESVKLGKGQMLVLDESAAYSVVAKRKTFFLLTFTKAFTEKVTPSQSIL
jgi:quercetin dioxygenase-like cupin family protein